MIDHENEVFTRVKNAIIAKYPNANIVSVYVNAPAVFPHISIVETDNYDIKDTLDGPFPKFSASAFKIDIYSNQKDTAKLVCKDIANIADDAFHSMNFFKQSLVPMQNLNDATLYRMTGIYTVVSDKNNFYQK